MTPPTTVYVQLLDEGAPVWRPAAALLEGDAYRLVGPAYDREDEHWEFDVGERVRCEWRRLDGGDVLVAVARAEVDDTQSSGGPAA
jgi:hypothetical protein